MDSATLMIVEARATDCGAVPVADWFFNGSLGALGEAAGSPPGKPKEKAPDRASRRIGRKSFFPCSAS